MRFREEFQKGRKQFSRTIRKVVLRTYRCFAATFAHKKALSPWSKKQSVACKHAHPVFCSMAELYKKIAITGVSC